MKQTDVTAFGEILIDFTHSGTADNGAVLFARHPGGAPGNVAVQVARLGGTAAFLGKAGNDMHGQFLADTLKAEGVGTEGLLLDDRYFTTLAFVSVDETGERTFSFARKPGADTQISADELNRAQIRDAKIFHAGSLSLTHEPARSATLEAIREAKAAGALVSYDPNYRASLWNSRQEAMEAMRSLVPFADLMKISDEETELLTGKADPEEALQALLDAGVKFAAVTLGADGAMAGTSAGIVKVPGIPSPIADTNGAGDSFWGAILWQFASRDLDPEELDPARTEDLLRFANAAAALTVRRPGAIPAMPDREAVETFLAA
ncbi:carbohydrate kinase family protein [Faecalibaculum rodentium]|uniref:carbohydrate kinase family protein n=1 Tax=Faecalibaculum rodentium TaxID=1702221 RepID=UPI001F57C21D|nr:carbohydrate kinase [Faecalibaculum rodentium]